MTKSLLRRLWLLALLPVFILFFQPASSQAAGTPFDRPGMWIWYVSSSHGGNLTKIIRQARRARIGTLYIKSADGTDPWSQFNPRTVKRLKRAGLNVCGWHYVYGRRPIAEARISALAKRRGADCFVIDAEAEYEGKYAAADWYIRRLKRLVGPKFPLALSTFPYAHYHQAFPYSVFLGPGAAQYNLPQDYWHTIGDRVRTSVEITFEQNRLYKRPVYPIGQTYENPGGRAMLAFRRFMNSYETVPSWWSWQETNRAEWRVLGRKVGKVRGYRPYRGHPTLRFGSKGDHVLWLQQHLIAHGNRLQPNGVLNRVTLRAVRRIQRQSGLPVTGVVDTRTWNHVLRTRPVRIHWSGAAKRGRRAGVSTPNRSAPLSANLPAKMNELEGVKRGEGPRSSSATRRAGAS